MSWCDCGLPHVEAVLCDDGLVSTAACVHDGTAFATGYTCTGHAHLHGLHVRCLSPVHKVGAGAAVHTAPATAGASVISTPAPRLPLWERLARCFFPEVV
jgi:hypothetical protein